MVYIIKRLIIEFHHDAIVSSTAERSYNKGVDYQVVRTKRLGTRRINIPENEAEPCEVRVECPNHNIMVDGCW